HVDLLRGFHAFFAQLGTVGKIGVGGAGTNAGKRDGAFVQLLVQPAAKGQYERFGGGIERKIGNGLVGGRARDIEDIGPRTLVQTREEEPRYAHKRRHIELHHVEVFLQTVFFKRTAETITGIVDQDADLIALGTRPVVNILRRMGRRKVESEIVGTDLPPRGEFRGQLLQEIFRAGDEQKIIAAGCQLSGDGPADTFAGPG